MHILPYLKNHVAGLWCFVVGLDSFFRSSANIAAVITMKATCSTSIATPISLTWPSLPVIGLAGILVTTHIIINTAVPAMPI